MKIILVDVLSFDKTYVLHDYFQVARVFFVFCFFTEFFPHILVSRICKLYCVF